MVKALCGIGRWGMGFLRTPLWSHREKGKPMDKRPHAPNCFCYKCEAEQFSAARAAKEKADDRLALTTGSPSLIEYQPESWSMLKDSIYAARDALRSGMEYAEELLAEKDRSLGRAHKSNRESAEMMEIEIEKMKSAFEGLSKPNGCLYGASSLMDPDGVRRQADLSPDNVIVQPPPETAQ